MTALNPRQKLMAAGVMSALLALAAAVSSGSLTTGARIIVGALAVAALATWVLKQKGLPLTGRFAQTPRLQVVQKVGLSARAGVALIEVDGRSFLVVHGDGAPRIRRVSSRAAVMAQTLKEAAS
ncbi:MAG: flagellar biosynthetic protein FliO [Myxococcales bacterium]|nr:flagellar biosynthetic protein FliO [Myxococcales bacterium]MDP3504501.1 flagellar biosynthetic protein FliO [Myxococcales bacterium]